MGVLNLVLLLSMATSDATVGSLSMEDLDRYIAQHRRMRRTCGPVALWYASRRLGKHLALDEVLQQAPVKEDGLSLKELVDLSHSFGVPCTPLQVDRSRLEQLPVPSILVIASTHCVVYEGLDPAQGTISYFEPSRARVESAPIDRFMNEWSGQALVFERPAMSLGWFIGQIVVSLSAVLLLATLVLVKQNRGKYSPGENKPA
jgi:ABC-type bacteriocin/lantibiotic exporter with double-glycine peptidase domain